MDLGILTLACILKNIYGWPIELFFRQSKSKVALIGYQRSRQGIQKVLASCRHLCKQTIDTHP